MSTLAVTPLDIAQWVILLASVVGSLAALSRTKLARWAMKPWVNDSASQTSESVKLHIEPYLAELRAEMNPNSGKTMRDAIDRIEKNQSAMAGTLDEALKAHVELRERQAKVEGQVQTLTDLVKS